MLNVMFFGEEMDSLKECKDMGLIERVRDEE